MPQVGLSIIGLTFLKACFAQVNQARRIAVFFARPPEDFTGGVPEIPGRQVPVAAAAGFIARFRAGRHQVEGVHAGIRCNGKGECGKNRGEPRRKNFIETANRFWPGGSGSSARVRGNLIFPVP